MTMSAHNLLVQLSSVDKSIDNREVLRGVSLSILPGRVLALLGPNGAGKTTSVRTMTGLIRPEAGTVSVLSEVLTPDNADRLRTNFGVQSDGALYESLTVRDNLDLWGRLYGMGRNDRRVRIDELLELLSLRDRADSRLNTLSKGLRQRVAISRALMSRPPILLLDEPTAGLDPVSVRELYGLLKSLRDDSGIGIMVCTHQLDGIQSVCDDVAIIDRGSIQLSGAMHEAISERWPTVRVEIETAAPFDFSESRMRELGVMSFELDPSGVSGRKRTSLEIRHQSKIPEIVSRLVERGVGIFSVKQAERSLEDLYFDVIEGDAS